MTTLTRRALLCSTGLGVAVSLTGCNGLPTAGTPTESPQMTTPTSESNPDYVRPCDERVWGGPFDRNNEDYLNIGPVTLAKVDNLPLFDASEPSSGGTSVKVLIVIDPGSVVTLVVPQAQRENVALDYNWHNWYGAGDPLHTAQWAVRFEACGSETPRQYNGGIIVTGPRCVTLDVWVDDANNPRKAMLPFGTECE